MAENAQNAQQIDEKFLSLLRCPVAVRYTDRGDNPGRLELVRGTWLVSPESGYKYPILDGMPILLISQGEQWKDTPIEDLPVPPPPIAD